MDPTVPTIEPVTTPSEPPVVEKPKTSWATSFLFLILGILIGAGGLWGYQWYLGTVNQPKVVYTSPTPTADPIASWRTYTNTKYGFTFKYPQDWVLDSKDAELSINSVLNLSNGSYNIQVWSNLERVGGSTKIVSSKQLSISGINLFERDLGSNVTENTGTFEIGSTDSSPTFKYKDKIFDINFTYPFGARDSSEYRNNLEIFHQILSTFKFLGQETNLKTYSANNVSFSYPADWALSTYQATQFHIRLKLSDKTQDQVETPGGMMDFANYTIDIALPPNNSVVVGPNPEAVTVGGIKGQEYKVGTAPSSGPGTEVLVNTSKGNYVFDYTALAHPETNDKYLSVFNQILSTFKFSN